MKKGFVETITASVLKESDGLVFPSTRVVVVDELIEQRRLTPRQAADHEAEAHQFAAGRLQWYVPAVQYLLAEAKRGGSAVKTINAFVSEANTPPPEIPDPVANCVAEIEQMRFKCDVPGSDEGGRRCPKRACGSTDLEAVGRQTSSLDEGQTVMFKCRKCGQEFR